jgi:hypothetical protein
MNIPSYQMHNILNAYSRQLRRNKSVASRTSAGVEPHLDQINPSSEGKRRAALKKVNENILTFMNNLGSQSSEVRPRAGSKRFGPNRAETVSDQRHMQFEFHVIEDADTKTRNSLSIEDFSSFFDQTKRRSGGRPDREVKADRAAANGTTVKSD